MTTVDVPWIFAPSDAAFAMFLAGFDPRRMSPWEKRALESARGRQ